MQGEWANFPCLLFVELKNRKIVLIFPWVTRMGIEAEDTNPNNRQMADHGEMA